VIVEAGAEISAVFLDDARRQLVTSLISVSGFVLLESLFRSLAGHADIETLQHSVELWIRSPESVTFRKYPLR